MASQAVENPLITFTGLDGQPLQDGYVYFGEPDQNPIEYPVSVYFDEALTIPATQPIRTNAGYLWRNGTPARVWVNGNYSTLVQDSRRRQVYYAADWTAASAVNVVTQQAGTGAVLRSVQDKDNDLFNAKDYGAVGDGSTDDRADINAAAAHLVTIGGTLNFKQGEWYASSGMTLPWPVSWKGSGPAHHAFPTVPSTIFKAAGQVGGDVLSVLGPAGRGNQGISDMSIYNVGNNAIRAIVGMEATLHPFMYNVEIAGESNSNGIGLQLRRNVSSVIYGSFFHMKIGEVQIGLELDEDCNANNWFGGSIQGAELAINMPAGTLTPLGNGFFGVAQEGVYSVGMEHEYLPPGENVVGYPVNTAGLYVVKLTKIMKATTTVFAGGYAELGGVPATYDDGVNGVHSLIAVIEVGADARDTIIVGMRQACYVLDRGIGTEIIGTQAGLPNYWTRSPPCLVRRTSVATAIPAFTPTAIPFATVLVETAGRFTFNGANTICTVAFPGTYEVTVQLNTDAMTAASTRNRATITMGGQIFRGPSIASVATSSETGLTCTAIMALVAGDTISVSVSTEEATTIIADSTYNTLMIKQI